MFPRYTFKPKRARNHIHDREDKLVATTVTQPLSTLGLSLTCSQRRSHAINTCRENHPEQRISLVPPVQPWVQRCNLVEKIQAADSACCVSHCQRGGQMFSCLMSSYPMSFDPTFSDLMFYDRMFSCPMSSVRSSRMLSWPRLVWTYHQIHAAHVASVACKCQESYPTPHPPSL